MLQRTVCRVRCVGHHSIEGVVCSSGVCPPTKIKTTSRIKKKKKKRNAEEEDDQKDDEEDKGLNEKEGNEWRSNRRRQSVHLLIPYEYKKILSFMLFAKKKKTCYIIV